MIRPLPLIGIGVAVVAAGWLLVTAADRVHFGPRRAKLAKIDEIESRLALYEKAQRDAPRVAGALQVDADRTLGPDRETVDHHLRERLNRIAEEIALEGAAVGTAGFSARKSPASGVFRGSAVRALREEIDFVELEGWITAEGTLEQVVRLIDRVEAEPWLKLVNHVKLDGRDNGQRVTATIRLTTLFLPGRAPSGDAIAAPYDPGRLRRYAKLTSANPFQLPPPETPAPPPTELAAEPTPEPEFPWGSWALTGVAHGPGGEEAWLLNRASGESLRLAVGRQIHDAVLAAAADDWAEFSRGEQRFRIQVGKSLDEGVPVTGRARSRAEAANEPGG